MIGETTRWLGRGPHRVVGVEIGEWAVVEGENVAVFAQVPATEPPDAWPAVVLSHGLGGSHFGYASLGAHLASHGFAVLHPQYLDSLHRPSGWRDDDAKSGGGDPDEASRAGLLPMLFDPEHWRSRVLRLRAVVDSLATQPHLPVRLRSDGVVLAGHSYGAYVTQLLLGVELFGVGAQVDSSAHPAVGCGILLSPQGSGDRGLTDASWDAVTAPLLEITATRDLGPHGEGLSWRREPFDRSRSPLKHLVVVRGGDHYLGGLPSSEDDGPVPAGEHTTARGVRRAVAAVALAFAQSLEGDDEAGAWLGTGPIPSVLDHESFGRQIGDHGGAASEVGK